MSKRVIESTKEILRSGKRDQKHNEQRMHNENDFPSEENVRTRLTGVTDDSSSKKLKDAFHSTAAYNH